MFRTYSSVGKCLKLDILEELFSDFNVATGIAITLIDHQSRDVLIRAGRQEVCKTFFQPHPVAGRLCQQSKEQLVDQLGQAGESVFCICKNGIVMGCTPIVVGQERIADLFVGQLFFDLPDYDHHRQEAHRYSFDEQTYLTSLEQLPIYPEDKFLAILRCIASTVQLVLNMTLELEEQMVEEGTAELERANQKLAKELEVQKRLRNALMQSQVALEKEQVSLEESNTALRVLIKRADAEKVAFEEQVSMNLMSLVDPYLEKLKRTSLDRQQEHYLEVIESHLKSISSPFVRSSVAIGLKLTPGELQVANLIRQGKTSKQIAELLSLSRLTVDKHRNNIRKKIGISNQKINLKTFLNSQMSVSQESNQDLSSLL